MGNSTETIVQAEDVWYVYFSGAEAVKGVSLSIGKGEFVGLMGQNGSGKTTLAKTFNGLLKPTKGRVIVAGMDTKKASISDVAQKVGYVFQNPDHQLVANSVADELRFGLKNIHMPPAEIEDRTKAWIERLGFQDLRTEHPYFLTKGQRQMLALASALIMEPELIIVDEPTTGMDMKQSYDVMNFLSELNRQGTAVIIISHNMRLVAEFTRRTIVMNEGKVLVDGRTPDVFVLVDKLRQAFLEPPEITRLALKLSEYGLSPKVVSVSQMVEEVSKILS